MANFNGQVVIATRKSLYFMGGQPYPGEADDPDITGELEPGSGVARRTGAGDGRTASSPRVTTSSSWRATAAGSTPGWGAGWRSSMTPTEEANWLRIGPEGVRCYGACVASDWLIVAVESRYGEYEAWGFDGQGWWLLFQRDATPAVIWPMALAGAGNREALLFRDGGDDLRPAAAALALDHAAHLRHRGRAGSHR